MGLPSEARRWRGFHWLGIFDKVGSSEVVKTLALLKIYYMEKEQYENLKERLIGLEKALKLEDKKNKVAQLEMDSTDSELWQNPYKAREITTTLAHLSDEVLQWERLEKRILDLEDVYELADDKDLKQIEKSLRIVELQTFLNGPYDHGNAVIYFYS